MGFNAHLTARNTKFAKFAGLHFSSISQKTFQFCTLSDAFFRCGVSYHSHFSVDVTKTCR